MARPLRILWEGTCLGYRYWVIGSREKQFKVQAATAARSSKSKSQDPSHLGHPPTLDTCLIHRFSSNGVGPSQVVLTKKITSKTGCF